MEKNRFGSKFVYLRQSLAFLVSTLFQRLCWPQTVIGDLISTIFSWHCMAEFGCLLVLQIKSVPKASDGADNQVSNASTLSKYLFVVYLKKGSISFGY